MQQVTLEEACTRLQDLIEAAAQGEEVFITKNEGTVAQLLPRSVGRRKRKAGSAKGLIWMAPDSTRR